MGIMMFAAEAAHGHGTHLDLHQWSLIWSSLVVIGFLWATALMARSQVGLVPRGMAAAYEHVFDWLEGVANGFIGARGKHYVPMATSFFLFILISNWFGLLPWPTWHDHHGGEVAAYESPTISISTTLALALLAVVFFNALGLIKALFPPKDDHHHHHGEHGHDHDHHHHHHAPGGIAGLWAWISKLWDPAPQLFRELGGGLKLIVVPLFFLFLFLNTMERFLPMASLSLRLYGNIFAKHTVKVSIFSMMENMIAQGDPFSWLISLMLLGASIFVAMLGALAGFLQAMIFVALYLSYVGHAVSDEH